VTCTLLGPQASVKPSVLCLILVTARLRACCESPEIVTRDTARIDWSDGSYTLTASVEHFSFDAVGQATEVFTNAHTDDGDFFTAAGVFEFRATFHEVVHFTVTDGIVRVDLQKGLFHFFDDC
jgi:hypothetical protein